jgi:transposase
MVIGLLTSIEGEPLAIRAFRGNTADPSTVAEQITCLQKQFDVSDVIFVGDRGMVKSKGKKQLNTEQLHYITALTDAQVRTLLKENILQPDLFDDTVVEVGHANKRYVLRRNEQVRRREKQRIEDKLKRLGILVTARNEKTQASKRADVEKGLINLQNWVKKYRLQSFVTLTLKERQIMTHMDEAAKTDAMLLDGCYVMETDVAIDKLSKEEIDASYRNLQQMERDFRTLKTGFLEIRPIFVRKKTRTQGHVFVAMLALKIIRLFDQKLQRDFKTTEQDPHTITREDALVALSRFIFLRYQVNDEPVLRLPQPDDLQRSIFKALGISLPRQKTSL